MREQMLTTSKSHFQGMEMGKSAVPSPTKPLIDIIVRSKNPARPGLHTIVLSMQEKTGGKDVVLVTCLQNAVGPTTETPGAISGRQGEMAGMWWPTKWTRQLLNLGVAHAISFYFLFGKHSHVVPPFPLHRLRRRHALRALSPSHRRRESLHPFDVFFFLLPSSLFPPGLQASISAAHFLSAATQLPQPGTAPEPWISKKRSSRYGGSGSGWFTRLAAPVPRVTGALHSSVHSVQCTAPVHTVKRTASVRNVQCTVRSEWTQERVL